jgi:hypothetical protein
MPGSTSRLALPYPNPSDANNVPSDIQALAIKLDGIGVVYAEDTEAARPAFGTPGRFYICTDSGKLFVDNGTAWSQVNYSPTQLFSAKGDLLIASAALTGGRLGAGSDGQVLVSRGAATLGVDWENVLGQALELTGATTATRYVGGTITGAPTTGTFAVGDFVIARDVNIWVCTTPGSPGTWKRLGSAIANRTPTTSGAILSPFSKVGGNSNDPTPGYYTSSRSTVVPFVVTNTVTISALLSIITSQSGAITTVGIYADNGSGYPGTLLNSGTFIAANQQTYSVALPMTLTPAVYWLAMGSGGSYVVGASSSTAATAPVHILKAADVMPMAWDNIGNIYSDALSYVANGVNVPTTFPARTVSTVSLSVSAPYLFLQVA